MDAAYWQSRWDDGRLGFHLGTPHPALVRHAARFDRATRVLVPLAGKAADLDLLATAERRVIANEYVEKAAREFFAERDVTPTERRVDGRLRLEGGPVGYDVGDFFTLRPEQIGGHADAAFDRAALVAVDPRDRDRYARTLASLLAPGAFLLLVTFELNPARLGRGVVPTPPNPIGAPEVHALFTDDFEVEELHEEPAPPPSSPRQADIADLIEKVYAMRRR